MNTFEDLPLSDALRRRSPEALHAALLSLLKEGEAEWVKDYRDLMVAMAPYHHCAKRLGIDVQDFFREVAADAPSSLQKTVEQFGRRTDVTPKNFGFRLKRSRKGHYYRSTL